MHYPYVAFLRGTGLTVEFLRLQWYTTAINRTIVKWASSYPRLFRLSFDCGILVSVIALPIVFIAHILWTFFSFVASNTNDVINEATPVSSTHDIAFEIMLPGVNLPLNEIGYYISSLALCTVIHELGHAFAAVLEDVPVNGFGFYIFLVFPMAYTDLSSDHLNTLKIWSRLRVLAAGIWHNLLLAFGAYVIFSSLSVFCMPLYSTNTGVIVTQIRSDSPLIGARGLQIDDTVNDINGCSVIDLDSWYDCLLETIRNPPAYCISSDFLLNHDESVPVYHSSNEGLIECCDRRSETNVCFEYLSESFNGVLEIPQHMCLNARKTIENSFGYCHRNSKECSDNFCIKPLLNNATTMIRMKRTAALANDVLYIGHPADISNTVKVSEFVPKTRLFKSGFADGLATFLKYIVVFSLGLAIVNIVPCFAFDGQHIVSAVIHHSFAGIVPERNKRDLIAFVTTCFGSILFIAGLLKVLYATISKYK